MFVALEKAVSVAVPVAVLVAVPATVPVRLAVADALLEPVPVTLDDALLEPVPVTLDEGVPVSLPVAVAVSLDEPAPVRLAVADALLEPVPVTLDDAVDVPVPVRVSLPVLLTVLDDEAAADGVTAAEPDGDGGKNGSRNTAPAPVLRPLAPMATVVPSPLTTTGRPSQSLSMASGAVVCAISAHAAAAAAVCGRLSEYTLPRLALR